MASSTHDSPPKLPFCNIPNAIANAEIRRPAAFRPSDVDPPNPRAPRYAIARLPQPNRGQPFPSLKISYDEETKALRTLPSFARSRRDHERVRMNNAPQPRIRPTSSTKVVKMPSPLARRGAAERAYLQGQLRAEALRRRKQEQHNEVRKLREIAHVAVVKDDHKSDGDISLLIEKLKFGSGVMGPSQECQNDFKYFPMKSHGLREPASSPPAILKSSFKRSVSEVLKESGIDEDENLLFFPDGVPLLSGEEEIISSGAREGTDFGSVDEKSSFCENGEGSAHEFERSNSISQECSSSDDLSPLQSTNDVACQLGSFICEGVSVPSEQSFPTHKGNKKVTLQPKMTATKNKNTHESAQPRQHRKSTACKNSDGTSFSEHPEQTSQANFPVRHTLDNGCIKGDLLGASESFQQLLYDGEYITKNPEYLHSDMSYYTHGSNIDSIHLLSFSSPHAEFFSMPDDTDHIQSSVRKQLGTRMPKLSEVSMPDMMSSRESEALDEIFKENSFPLEITTSGLFLKEPPSECNFRTPDHYLHDLCSIRKQMGVRMPKLPELCMPDMIDSKVSKLANVTVQEDNAFFPMVEALVLKEPLSESNFRTPDNSLNDQTSICKRLTEGLPEILGVRMHQGKESQAFDAAIAEKKVFSYCTPDNSYSERCHSCKLLGEEVLEIPQLRMPQENELTALDQATKVEPKLSKPRLVE